MVMDWTDEIHIMSREDLEILTIHALGYLSCFQPHINQTPEQVFEFINNIGKTRNQRLELENKK